MTDEQAVLDAERQHCELINAGRIDELGGLLAGGYQRVHATGAVTSKSETLGRFRATPRRIERGELTARVLGDTAVLLGTLGNHISMPGEPDWTIHGAGCRCCAGPGLLALRHLPAHAPARVGLPGRTRRSRRKPDMPTSDAREGILEAILQDLVHANHILYHQGVVDAFGHISARDPERPDRFWISRSRAPALVGRGDLLCLDLDGNAVDDSRQSYLERFIHSEVYRARPDVMAVLHSHSPTVIPFGVTGEPFRSVCHLCGFLPGQTPVFEIRECAGTGSDLLVRNSQLGAAFARTLGDKDVALMRGHGVTVVARTVRQAVLRGVYTEVNAKLLLQSLSLRRDVTYLTDEEADAVDANVEGQVDRAWDLWLRDLS